MRFTFEVPGTLPTLNEYVSLERSNRYAAANLKRKTQDYIVSCIPKDAPTFPDYVEVWIDWVRPNARCDKDNVAFAKKFILDALQEAGVITKDSWNLCTPHDRKFAVNKADPRTVVVVTDKAI